MTTPNTNSSPPQLSTLQQQPDSVTQQQDHFLTFENDWLHPFLAHPVGEGSDDCKSNEFGFT